MGNPSSSFNSSVRNESDCTAAAHAKMPFITRNFALAAAIALLPFCDTQLLVPGSVPDAASTGVIPKSTVKILVCGDSISQGQEGDFTWRYRLWEWFRSNAQQSAASSSVSSSSSSSSIIPVGGSSTSTSTSKPIGHFSPSLQYVGPFNGTLPAGSLSSLDASNPQTWGPYHPDVDPAFSPGNGSSHFAVYGRPAWLDIDKIRGQVETYRPDMVLLHLGFNDFGWWSNTAENLIESMQKLVFNARLGRRDVTILIADVSHRLLVTGRDDVPITTRAYNKMLWEKVDEWSTLESPVVVVRVSEEYACKSSFPSLHVTTNPKEKHTKTKHNAAQ